MRWQVIILAIELMAFSIPAKAQNGLVAHWSFDEMVNDTIFEHTGHATAGISYGASLIQGAKGKAISFDGSDDYVRIMEKGS